MNDLNCSQSQRQAAASLTTDEQNSKRPSTE